MEKTALGKTGLQVSRLGAGLAEIGTLDDLSTASRVLNAALDGGIDFLDTAACYGRSEEWIGRSIAHRRHEYVLATKAGHVIDGYEGKEWTATTILDSIERSLKRMQTDYLDLVQLHSCSVEVLERGEVIVGTANPAHMKANIARVEDELPIPAEVVRELHRRFDQMARR